MPRRRSSHVSFLRRRASACEQAPPFAPDIHRLGEKGRMSPTLRHYRGVAAVAFMASLALFVASPLRAQVPVDRDSLHICYHVPGGVLYLIKEPPVPPNSTGTPTSCVPGTDHIEFK